MIWSHVVYYLILIVILLTGLAINLLALPGLWLMLAGVAAYAWITGGIYAGKWWLLILLGLTLLAEVIEFVAGSAGAKKAGGSKRGMVGAIVGGLIGAIAFTGIIPIPVVGTIFGVCLGTFVGAMGTELLVGKKTTHSAQIGWGAAKGRFVGTMVKLIFGFVILILAMVATFPA